MGEGELAGVVTRGLLCGLLSEAAVACGALLAMAGEPATFIEPKLMFGGLAYAADPPLGMCPLVPVALIITDDGRRL